MTNNIDQALKHAYSQNSETPQCSAFFYLCHNLGLRGNVLTSAYTKVLSLIDLTETIRIKLEEQ